MNSSRKQIFDTARSSLIFVVIGFVVVCGLPEWFFVVSNLHLRGTLTLEIGIVLAILAIVLNAGAGALFWATILEPIRRRRRG
jgi:hypothetical protein